MADEINNLSKYRKAQKTFKKLFLMSFAVLFVFLLFTPLFFYQSLDSKAPTFSNSSIQNTNSTVYSTPYNDIPKTTPALSNANSASYNRPIIKATPEISPKMTPVATGDYSFPFVLAAFLVTGVFSLFATVFTFLGFLTMTIFAWRKEKREAAGFRLETAKKEIEIEKLKVELEKSKSSTAGKIKKCAACNRTYTDASLNFCLDDGAVLSEIYTSKDFNQNPFEKTQVMEGNLPTEQISAETEEIKNKNTAK